MADLNINVTTTADTTGLDELNAKLSGVSEPVPDQLTAAGAKFDPVKNAFVSITQEGGAAAQAAQNIGLGATLAGAQLNKARGEATVLARELATGSVNARTVGAFLGALGPTIAVAAIAGLGLSKIISAAGEETVKFNDELKKMSDELNKQEGEWF